MPRTQDVARSSLSAARGLTSCCAACVAVLAVLIGSQTSVTECPAGVLDGIRDDVRADTPDPPKRERRRDHHHDHDHDDDHVHGYIYFDSGGDAVCDDGHHHGCDGCNSMGEVLGIAALWALSSPYWAPHGALGDDFAVPMYFQDYPYDTCPGALCRVPGRFWSGRLRSDYGDDFNDLSRISGHLLLTTSERWGLDTEATRWEERLPEGGVDRLWTGDANIVFRFAQDEQFQFRSGLGFNWLQDRVDTDYGWNFTYGLDFFPCKPWVLSATLDSGRVGETSIFHFRATAGLMVNRVEVYTGYDHFAIGDQEINTLVGGLRVWF